MLAERVFFFSIGGVLGFILGYIVATIRRIRDDLEKADHIKHKQLPKDAGLTRYPLLLDIALFVVVAITIYSSFQSQIASNRSNRAIDSQKQTNIVTCQNANENRHANLVLWNFIFDLSFADPRNKQNPKEIQYLHTIQAWVASIYRAHDCHNLDKKYRIAPAPKILIFSHKQGR